MADLTPSEKSSLLDVLHGAGGVLDVPQPYARDIFLYATCVAGTSFVENMKDIAPTLQVGDTVRFFREPNNPYDRNAIVVRTESGQKLGYVPRIDNVVFSRLMDAGKLLFGKLSDIEPVGDWLRLEMEIYMHE